MVSPRYFKLLTNSTGCPQMNVRLSVGGVLDVYDHFLCFVSV